MKLKKIGENLDNIEQTEQIKRYLDSAIAQNFILTNFLEFRWYKEGKLQIKGIIGEVKNNKIIATKQEDIVKKLIEFFLNYQEKVINNYNELAEEMATVTKALCYSIEEALKKENDSGQLTELKLVFQDLLLPDLNNENFADMYAQTIAYGLFTARIGHSEKSPSTDLLKARGVISGGFNRENASYYISDKIPFLKGLFDTIISTNIFI